jgi:hypothetical protein
MLDVDCARGCVANAEMVVRQKHFVEQLKTEGADATEAESHLACFVSVHLRFEKRLRAALQEEGTRVPARF